MKDGAKVLMLLIC